MKSYNSTPLTGLTLNTKAMLITAKKVLNKRGSIIGTSILLSYISIVPLVSAAPLGGNITGGEGTITQSGLTTTIKQNTSSLGIDWNSFNVNSNETVNFIQPDSSSIALNRILSQSGSEIHGQINANGQVILVNPNGIFFGSSSTVNVGGLIASGLDISSTDFMNGDYIFNNVAGTDGIVFNAGLLTASLGGSIALLGQQIVNEGIISARFGRVSLAAGKAAVLTFDQQGMLGIQVTEAILQDQIGVDPAVLNSGEINAAGGRVLLTASVSQDVFSQAVNSGDIEQATSVVVHEDGSFTLGAGADVVNTGTIVASTSAVNENAGQIVVLGESVTSSGMIQADSLYEQGGEIELQANDKIELIQQAIVSAQAINSGTGGSVKLLGDKIGLLDSSSVNVSGANGGGEALIGGDKQGENNNIRNADFLFMSENATVFADAKIEGDGGKIITYADDTTRIYGYLFARGSINGGNGGFIETSGKRGFSILNAPDVSASSGDGGLWLIDPYNISIQSSGVPASYDVTGSTDYTSSASSATIDVDTIVTALGTGDVSIVTGVSDPVDAQDGNIDFNTSLNYNGIGDRTLTLEAANNITFALDEIIFDGTENTQDSLNINLYAKGDIKLNDGVIIDTQGGNFTVGYVDPNNITANDIIPTSFTSYTDDGAGTITSATIDTSGAGFIDRDTAAVNAGNISITSSGAVSVNSLIAVGGTTAASNNQGNTLSGGNGGNITISAATVAVQAVLNTSGTTGRYDDNDDNGGGEGGHGGSVSINTDTGSIQVEDILTSGGNAAGENNYGANGGNAGQILLSSATDIIINDNLIAIGGEAAGNNAGDTGDVGDGGNGNLIQLLANSGINLNASINSSGGLASDLTTGLDGNGGAITLNADVDRASTVGGDLIMSPVSNSVITNGGQVTLTADVISLGNITTSGGKNQTGGSIGIDATGDVSVGTLTTNGGLTHATLLEDGTNIVDITGLQGGDVTIDGVSITISGDINTTGSNATYDVAGIGNNGQDGGNGGIVNITALTDGNISVEAITTQGGVADGDYTDAFDTGSGGDAGTIDLNTSGSGIITLNGDITATGAQGFIDDTDPNNIIGSHGDGANVALNGAVTLANEITIDASGAVDGTVIISGINGNVDFNNTLNATNDRLESLTIVAGDVNFRGVVGATRLGNLTLNATGAVNALSDVNSVITLNSLSVNNLFVDGTSTSFTSGDINTQGDESYSLNTDQDGITATGNSGSVTITSSGAISTGDIITMGATSTVNEQTGFSGGKVTITSAGQVTVGSIDSEGGAFDAAVTDSSGFNGADVILSGSDIEVGTIKSAGTDAITNATPDLNGGKAGAITLTATDNTANGTPSITLNGDINSKGGNGTGTSGITEPDLTASLTLFGNDNPNGSINLTNTSEFSSVVNLNGVISTGNTGADILVSNGMDNVWIIDGNNSGSLNNNVTFSEFENLKGGDVFVDQFRLDVGGSISGTVSGGTGTGDEIVNNLNSSTSWDITGVNEGTVVGTNFSGIENLTGSDTEIDTFNLIAGNIDGTVTGGTNTTDRIVNQLTAATDWDIDGVNAVTVAGTSFSDIENLIGSDTQIDTFNLIAGNIDSTVTGGTNTTDRIVNQLTAATDWDIDGINAVTVAGTSFSDIENLIGSDTQIDTFNLIAGNIDGSVSGGANTTDIIVNQLTAATDWNITGVNQVTVAGITFTGIENLTGSDTEIDTFNLQAGNIDGTVTGGINMTDEIVNQLTTATAWDITGVNEVTVADTDFTGIENLTGSVTEIDTFNLQAGNIDGTVTGGTNTTDEIVNQLNTDTAWSISGINEISVAGTIFSEIENLTGASIVDTFTFTSPGSITGLVNGGSGVDEINLPAVDTTVQLGAVTGNTTNSILEVNNIENIIANSANNNILIGGDTPINWFINGSGSGSVGGLALTVTPTVGATIFSNFLTLNGGAGADTFEIVSNDISTILFTINGGTGVNLTDYDTLIGPNIDTTWTIDSLNSGTLVNSDATGVINIKFNEMENLKAGSGDDTFAFFNEVDGSVDAGTHTTGDTIDLSNLVVVTFNVADVVVGRVNFETVNGNWDALTSTGNSTIIGANVINDWQVTGDNSGSVESLIFTNFNNLAGGTDTDTFTFSSAGVIDGLIDGNGNSSSAGGIETIDLTSSLASLTVQQSNLNNQNNNNILEFSNIEQIDANLNLALNNQIIAGTGIANTWIIDSNRSGILNVTTRFNGFTVLTGGAGIDTFQLHDSLNFNGSIDGGGGIGDRVIAGARTTDWAITGANNTGTVTGLTGSFSEIENLQGNGGDFIDTFQLNDSLDFAGSIDGAGGTGDIVIAGARDSNWVITAANNTGTVTGLTGSFTEIENLQGNSGNFNDSLTGRNNNNSWTVNVANAGFVEETVSAADRMNFSSIEILTGGSADDDFTFSGTGSVTNVDGNGGNNVINGKDALNEWIISALDTGSVAVSAISYIDLFNDIQTINGSDSADSFTLSALSSAITLHGGANSNSLTGFNVANSWTIDGSNAQTVAASGGGSVTFSAIQNLTGGTADDDFTFSGSGSVSNIVGNGGTNTIIGKDLDTQWLLNAANAGMVTVSGTSYIDNFQDIQTITAGSGIDTLTGRNNNNSWTVDTANAGFVEQAIAVPSDRITFSNIENLTGGTANDDFTFSGTGSVTTIDGNGGTNVITGKNTLNDWILTAANAGNVTVAGTPYISSFLDIQSLNGGSNSDTLTARNVNNSWTVDTANAGFVEQAIAVPTDRITFSSIENLTGGTVNDDFTFSGTGSVTTINGNGGTNIITGKDAINDWTLTTANAGNVGIAGTFYITSFQDIQTITGGSGSDTLTGRNINNSWTVNAVDAGFVEATVAVPTDRINFNNIENLTGGDLNDEFILTAATLSGIIDGGNGNNSIKLEIDDGFTNNWVVSGADSGRLDGIINTAGSALVDDFSSIQNLTGSNDADIFTIASASFIANINGGNDDNSLDPNDQVNFNGLNVAFTVYLGSASGFANIDEFLGNTINPGLGTLVGDNAIANNWIIDDACSGSVNGFVFNDFANLTGGTGDDNFTFSASGSVINLVGNGGTNTLTGKDLDNDWILTAANTGNVAVAGTAYITSFQDIQTVTGGSAIDTLTGRNIDNNWTLNNADAGFVEQAIVTPTDRVTFSNIEKLNGGTLNDNFTFSATGSVTTIDANSGSNTITGKDFDNNWILNAANAGSVAVAGVSYIDSFINVQTLTGGTGNDNLTGRNANNSWLVNAANAGFVEETVALPTDRVNFSNIENLLGGTANDDFTISGTGSVTSLDGNGGNNRLTAKDQINDWLISGMNIGSVSVSGISYVNTFSDIQVLTGGNLVDNFNIAALDASITLDGSAGADSLTGFNVNNAWTVDGSSAQTLLATGGGTIIFGSIENLIGGTAGDDYVFSESGSVTNIDGNGGINNLNGKDALNQWVVTGTNAGNVAVGGTLYIDSFNDIQSIGGGDLADSFTITALNAAITLDGAAGSDSLAGFNADNVWILDGSNGQTLAASGGGTVSFGSIEKLTGGTSNDDFTFSGPAAVSTIVGNAGNNSLTGKDQLNDWIITGANAGSVSISGVFYISSFIDIQTIIGGILVDNFSLTSLNAAITLDGVAGADSLSGYDAVNVWTIDGSHNQTLVATGGGTVTFDNVQNLTGGTLNDAFIFSNTGSVTSLDGYGGFNNLTGKDQLNDWIISGANSGNVSVTGISYVDAFTDIQSITGGALVDDFSLTALNATIIVDGGSDLDSLRGFNADNVWTIDGSNVQTLTATGGGTVTFGGIENFIGGTADDDFNISATGSVTSLDGNGGINSLSAKNQLNDWFISGADSGNVATGGATYVDSFIDIQSLSGGNNDDAFVFGAAGSVSGTIDGAAQITGDSVDLSLKIVVSVDLSGTDYIGIESFTGNDTTSTLIAANNDNSWTIDTENDGTVSGINFIDFNHLTGGSADDDFTFSATGSITGLIDGAGHTVGDAVNGSDLAVFNVTLGSEFDNIEFFTGNNANSIFTGQSLDNDWAIFKLNPLPVLPAQVENQGTVTDQNGVVVTFDGFTDISGGNQRDNFLVDASGGISGTINGGDGIDTVDFSSLLVVDASVDTALAGFSNIDSIEGINGNGIQSILRVGDLGSSWTITGNNSGSVTSITASGSSSTSFTNFNILQGGDGNDSFDLQSGGSIGDQLAVDNVSRINGGTGDDSLVISYSGSDNVKVNFFDGDGLSEVVIDDIIFSTALPTGSDSLTLLGGNADFASQSYAVDYVDQLTTLTYLNPGVTASVIYSGVETINDYVHSAQLIINANGDNNKVILTGNNLDGQGRFTVENNVFSFNPVNYQNKGGLTVNNPGAAGIVSLQGDATLLYSTGTFDFSVDKIERTGLIRLSGNELRLDSLSTGIDISNPILTSVNNLLVSNVNADVFVTESNGLNIHQADTTALLDIKVLNGDIGDNDFQGLLSSGTLNLTANTGDILLDNAGNAITGSVGLNTSLTGNATYNNSSSITTQLTTSNVGTLDVISLNADIESSDILRANSANFEAGSNDISLNNINNDFNILSIEHAASAVINDVDDILLGNIHLGSGAFYINSVGVGQQINSTFTQTPNSSDSAAGVFINASSGVINLASSGNNFIGNVSINNSGSHDVVITDLDSINLATSNIGTGTFSVNAGSGISQSGVILQQSGAEVGEVNSNAVTGSIKLNLDNDFTGDVALNNSGDFDVEVTDINTITLSSSRVGSGILKVNAGNGIFQSGALLQEAGSGIAEFTADTGSILLNNPGNDFNAAVSFHNSGDHDVWIADTNDLILGASNFSRNLSVFAGGDVTSSAIVKADGTTWIDTDGNNVIFDNFANNFNDLVIINANSVFINEIDDLNFGSTGTDPYLFGASSNITGDVNINTLSGNITDDVASILSVEGLANFSAGAGLADVILDSASNDFASVNIIQAQNVTLQDTDSIDILSSAINGDLNVTAVNDITGQNGSLEVSGDSIFTSGNNANVILDNIANQLDGNLTFNASTGQLANVSVVNTVATDIQALSLTNELSVVSGGNITQSGVFNVAAATLEAINDSLITQDIMLERINDITQLAISQAHNVTLNNGSNALSINELTATGAVDIASGVLTSTSQISADGVSLNSTSTNLSSINSTATVDINSEVISVSGDIKGTDVTLNSGLFNMHLASVTASGDISTASSGFTASGAVSGSDITINAGTSSANFTDQITSSSTLTVSSSGLSINGTVNASNDALFDATTGDAVFNNIILVDDGVLEIKGNNIFQNSTLDTLNGDIAVSASGSYTMNSAVSTQAAGGGLTVNSTGIMNLETITSQNDINLTSESDSINFNAGVNSVAGSLIVTAGNSIDIGGNQAVDQNIEIKTLNGGIVQNAVLTSEQGNISLDSSQGISMGRASSSNSLSGNIVYLAANNIDASLLTAMDDNVAVTSTNGAINDNNDSDTNFSASSVTLSAVNGIGGNNVIETRVASMNIHNSGSGIINLTNSGDLTIDALKNSGVTGDITITNDVDFHLNAGSIDAGYDTGDLFMQTVNGDFLGMGSIPDFSHADITARTAVFLGLNGSFGSTRPLRPLVLNIRDSVLIQTRASFNPRFADPRPDITDNSLLKFTSLDTLAAIAGQQLVEVETLSEIDPAIFTALQNFSLLDISIQMPEDQLFEDELEEYKKRLNQL